MWCGLEERKFVCERGEEVTCNVRDEEEGKDES